MKHRACIALAILAFISEATLAQNAVPAVKPLIYADLQANMGLTWGMHTGLAAILNERHEVGLAYEAYFAPIPDIPKDYDCPRCKHGFGNNWINGAAATYGYVLYPGRGQRFFRLTLRGGVLLGQQRVAENYVRVVAPGPREENYRFDEIPRFAAALVLRPSLDLAINRNFGLAVGPYVVLSPEFQGLGGVLGLRFGRVARDGAHYHLRELSQRRAAQGAGKESTQGSPQIQVVGNDRQNRARRD
jgi:hypothetical protein